MKAEMLLSAVIFFSICFLDSFYAGIHLLR